jgi:FtsP/CotA-like multicopper oxidase with cupredoxin domain
VPGPEIRVRLGQSLGVAVDNRLDGDTTVHWHGLRIAKAMDGVPGLTQPPIAAGASFAYEFTPPDAGSFWYHPHVRSSEQQGRGLHGVLIVDEPSPIAVDRDIVWVLDDWRLTRDAAVHERFGNLMDASHAGRIGNTVTLNGRLADEVAVRAGERVRLRLVNTANARIFALTFAGHAPSVVALAGQPVASHASDGGRLVLAPAQRVDLILDMAGTPGSRHRVVDSRDPRRPYRFVDLVYDRARPVRASPLDAPIRLAANNLAEPDLATARRHDIVLAGGAMGRM